MTSRFTGSWMTFDELSNRDLYAVLKLRVDVFVVEQTCPYPEIDGNDPQATHFLLKDASTGDLAAYIRMFGPTDADPVSRIGRVATDSRFRGQGLGRDLMAEGVAKAKSLWPDHRIEISAQSYLEKFYGGFGFKKVSDEYLEDGIPHIDMVLDEAD